MPVATLQAPDGKTLTLEVPEGATEAEILAFAEQAYQPAQNLPSIPGMSSAHAATDAQAAVNPGGVAGTVARRLTGEAGQQAVDAMNPGEEPKGGTESPYWLNLVREGLQGLTLNASDELGAVVAAGVATLVDGADFGDTYADMVGLIQQEQNAFRQENPKAALAAQVGGGLATGGGALAKVLAKAAGKSTLKKVGLSGVTGAGGGATAGFLGGDTMEERVDQAKWGAGVGGGLGIFGGGIGAGLQYRSQIRQDIADAISSGSTDRKVAKYYVDGAGKLQKDKKAIAAVKQGVDEGVVSVIKGASDADRRAALRMVRIAQRGKENARAAATHRPSDVPGRSLVARIKTVGQAKRRAGKMLEREADALRGQQADFTPAIDQFIDDLGEMGVTIERRGGVIRPNFSGSDIEDVAGAQNVISRVVHRLQKGDNDPYAAHRVKRFLSEQVNYGKSAEGLTGNSERVVKKLRHNLDAILDENFAGYKQANDLYAESKGALDAIQDMAGRKIDIEGKNADKALGTLTRSLLSNIRSRAGLMNALDDLDRVANKYRTFDDDITTQALFADELDRMFGAAAKTSLQGDAEKAVRQAATQDKSGVIADAAVGAYRKVRGVNDDNAFKALMELLED